MQLYVELPLTSNAKPFFKSCYFNKSQIQFPAKNTRFSLQDQLLPGLFKCFYTFFSYVFSGIYVFVYAKGKLVTMKIRLALWNENINKHVL